MIRNLFRNSVVVCKKRARRLVFTLKTPRDIFGIILIICAVIFGIVLVLNIPRMKTKDCEKSITTVSGASAAQHVCSGSLIFDENFDELDTSIWKHENSEFQWYVADNENSFVRNGKLHIEPTLTSSKIGFYEIENGHIFLDDCTDPIQDCERRAGGNIIINPIRSARLNTLSSFSFKYGRVEVIAKLPAGDWLWPAVWLLPTKKKFGEWPRSGEIDLFESRGNLNYQNKDGFEIGVEQVCSTLHFGPNRESDGFLKALQWKNDESGFHSNFHKYEMIWNEVGIRFFVDETEIGFVSADDGFWKRGGYNGDNLWASGTKMAPFDEEFHFIINLAVGGTTFFLDTDQNGNGDKPWNNTSEAAMKDFWVNRSQWLSSWHFDTDESSLIIDSIKVWAI